MTTENTTIQQFKMDDGQVHQFRMPNGLSVSEMTRLAADSYNQAKEQEFAQAQEQNVLETKPRSTLGVLGQSAIKGVAGLVDLPTGFIPNVKELYRYATTPNAELGKFSQPVTNALIHQGILKAENEPNTPLLKAMDFTAQLGTGGGINPFTIAKNTLPKLGRLGLQGGVGTTTQQVLESSNINPLGQAIGTALTMGAVGTPSALRSTVGDVARNSLKNVTPEQIKLADLLMKDAERLGSPLTAAEALAQVTGGNRLTSTQRIVENSPKSSQTMADFMNQRPGGNVNAFNQTVDQISPFSTTPLDLNQAATNFINRSEKGLTKRVNPLYKQATVEIMPLQSDITALKKTPDYGDAIEDAIKHVTKDPYSKVKNLPESDPKVLMAAKVYLDTQYQNFLNTTSGNKNTNSSSTAWGASRELDNYLKSKSPSYLQGSNAYEQTQTNFIQPRKEGMLGQLADTGGTTEGMMGQQRGILMPSAPKATSPKEISATIKLLRREDPNVVQNWTRQNLKSIFDENSQNLQSGPNQFGGAKFAADIAGNANQKANLRTLVSESASPEAWKGFETMLDVFQAQGKRLPAGSATAFNQTELETLKGGGVGKIPLLPTNLSKAMDVYEQFRLGKNTKKLADLLTDPEGLKKLEELSKTKPDSAKREVLTNSLAGGVIAGKSPINLTVTKEE
jgi:hypothetical protein